MKDNSSVVILAAMLFLCLALGAVAVEIRRDANQVMVIARQAFVYPDGEEFVLVTEKGEYALRGELVDGCYELHRAGLFEKRGWTEWSAETCANLGE